KQIALVQNFAAQAVIAIENTRLLNELRQRTTDLSESLEQQTATSEVLRVISSSPGDLQPVFQTMLENAVRICDAKFGIMFRFENEAFNLAALFGVPPALADFIQQRGSFQPRVGTNLERMWRTKDVVRITDDSTERVVSPAAEFGGARSLITVPMLKENVLIGAIIIYRQEVRPFTEKQIELVQNLAPKPSSPLRIRGFLMSCGNRWSSRQRLPMSCASSVVRQVTYSRCLKPCCRMLCEFAMRNSA